MFLIVFQISLYVIKQLFIFFNDFISRFVSCFISLLSVSIVYLSHLSISLFIYFDRFIYLIKALFILNNLNTSDKSLFEKLSCSYYEISYNFFLSSFSNLFSISSSSSSESSIYINSKTVCYSFSSFNSVIVSTSVVSTLSTSFIMFKSNLSFCNNFSDKNNISTFR